MRKPTLILAMLLLPLLMPAQRRQGQPLIDSLLGELAKAEPDTNKARLQDLISFTYSTIDPDKGIEYGMKALELSEQLDWQRGIASANTVLGVNYAARSENEKAIKYYKKAFGQYKEMRNENAAAGVLANISLIYKAEGNYPQALDFAYKALTIKEELRDTLNMAIILENIGSIYLERKDYAQTTKYYSKALEAYKKTANREGVARSLGNMAIVYSANGDYNKALEYQFMALEIKRKQGNKSAIQNALANIALIYFHMKNYSKALDYHFEALKISEEIGSKQSIAVNMGNIGETYLAMAKDASTGKERLKITNSGRTQDIDLAIRYLAQAVSICQSINFQAPEVEFSQYLAEAYSLSNNYKKAFETYKRHIALKDSVYSTESKVAMAELVTKRELELKDKDIIIQQNQLEIDRLKAKNERTERFIYILGMILLLLAAAIAFSRFRRRIQIQKNTLDDISQLQSHHIRGPVARILGLAQLFNMDDRADPINSEVIQHLQTAASQLDAIVKKIIEKTNEHHQPQH